VLFDHTGERGFCAGGDIRMLAESGAGDGVKAREFFFNEYRLNHLLFEYPKTTVAIMDGVTMGGGVGLSRPCRFRIATERTTFAMPETGIGLFPDVGRRLVPAADAGSPRRLAGADRGAAEGGGLRIGRDRHRLHRQRRRSSGSRPN
jgi:enoyl-CoA hydratase/carnithine racemase